jgi:hypothetical protein
MPLLAFCPLSIVLSAACEKMTPMESIKTMVKKAAGADINIFFMG